MSVNVGQCVRQAGARFIAVVEGNRLHIVRGWSSVYEAAIEAIRLESPLERVITDRITDEILNYDEVYNGGGAVRLLPPFDHPFDSSHCYVTGTGLSHRKSADNRNSMHSPGGAQDVITDSMRMYRSGEMGGRPATGSIGTPPEWFWKGTGDIVAAHGEPLDVPNYAEDGGDEAEIAGVYIIGPEGRVYRVGFAAGNEFSDHLMESRSYLHLAPSKLRQCSLGPEIVIGGSFEDVSGETAVVRSGVVIWSQQIGTGEANMVHSLANLEHHHFKYSRHRRPGDVHIHYYGTPGFSFGSGIRLRDGDQMTVSFTGFGRPLVNSVRFESEPQQLVTVTPL